MCFESYLNYIWFEQFFESPHEHESWRGLHIEYVDLPAHGAHLNQGQLT
jgi:hypothetical protein